MAAGLDMFTEPDRIALWSPGSDHCPLPDAPQATLSLVFKSLIEFVIMELACSDEEARFDYPCLWLELTLRCVDGTD